MTTKKNRKSPEESATKFSVGTIKKGNDGNNWIIIETKNKTHRWKKLDNSNNKTIKKSKSKFIHKFSKKQSNKSIKLSKSTIKDTEYLTHDNGGRPFKVSVNNKNVSIYKLPEDYNYDNGHANKKDYTILVKTYNNVKQIFIGKSVKGDDANGNNNFGLGNSVLLEIANNKYVFIGEVIFEFSTSSPVIEFFSMIGNNDVPYPLALTKDNVYFLIDKGVNGYLSKEYFTDFPKKYNWALDSYSKLWGQYPFTMDENNLTKSEYDKLDYSERTKLQKKISLSNKSKKFQNIKIIHNRI